MREPGGHRRVWAPTVYLNGAKAQPMNLRAHYEEEVAVTELPPGLTMVAGNSHAFGPQSVNRVYFGCGSGSGLAAEVSGRQLRHLASSWAGLRLATTSRIPTEWSPDGILIVWISYEGVNGGPTDIWVMNADGTDDRMGSGRLGERPRYEQLTRGSDAGRRFG